MAICINMTELLDYLRLKGLLTGTESDVESVLREFDIDVNDVISVRHQDGTLYYDDAELMGEEIDYTIRKLFTDMFPGLILEGGYNVITDDPNFIEAETLEIYYSIKKEL